MNLGICYFPNSGLQLVGYTDADWAGNADDTKNTFG